MPAPTVEGGHETILVVEDDKLVRDYVLTQLHSLGYVTLDAANATEALAIGPGRPSVRPAVHRRDHARHERPPACRRDVEGQAGLRVLFTSGYTENAIIHHGRLDEGVLLLAKPYRKSDMAIMIGKRSPIDRRRVQHASADLRSPDQLALTLRGHHDPDQVGGIPRAELLHDSWRGDPRSCAG
jgi:CheY-like chemotaxis protein